MCKIIIFDLNLFFLFCAYIKQNVLVNMNLCINVVRENVPFSDDIMAYKARPRICLGRFSFVDPVDTGSSTSNYSTSIPGTSIFR